MHNQCMCIEAGHCRGCWSWDRVKHTWDAPGWECRPLPHQDPQAATRGGHKASQEPQTDQGTEAWRPSQQDPCPSPHLQPSPGSHSAAPGLGPAASPSLLRAAPLLLDEPLATSLSRGPAPGCHRDGEDIYRCSRERRAQLSQGDQQRREASLALAPFSSTQVTVHLAGRHSLLTNSNLGGCCPLNPGIAHCSPERADLCLG